MAWKIMSSSSYKYWIGNGPPDIQTLLSSYRGLILNIPSVDGGNSSLITYDTYLTYRLRDGNYNNHVFYLIEGTSYPVVLSSTGNCVGLEFESVELISEIKLYTSVAGSNVLGSNTFFIMTSNDGTTWSVSSVIDYTDVILENYTTYSVLTFQLPEPIQTKFITVRSLNDLDIININGEYIREMEVYSPDGNFGVEGDTYKNYSTGKIYKKINNNWVLVFTPQPIPAHILGDSAIPPSGAGLPDGSIYFIKGVV